MRRPASPAADRRRGGAVDRGRLANSPPAPKLRREGGLLLFVNADRIDAEQEMQWRVVALHYGDHRRRRLGGITGLLAVAAVKIGFDWIDHRAVGVDALRRPHVDGTGEFSAESAWRDNRDSDAERLNLVPQRAAPAVECKFRGALGTAFATRHHRADVGALP